MGGITFLTRAEARGSHAQKAEGREGHDRGDATGRCYGEMRQDNLPQVRGDFEVFAVGFEGDSSLSVSSKDLNALISQPNQGFFVGMAEAVVSAARQNRHRRMNSLQKRLACTPSRTVVADF